jgi:hypothetical protein
MLKRLLQILSGIHKLPVSEQMFYLENEFDNWRSNHDQIDDVLIAGIRIV